MDTIAQIPLFAELENIKAERCAQMCSWRYYDANELIIDFDDETRDVRFLISGRVRVILRVETGKEMILSEMKDGEFFGELAAIDDDHRSANVSALTRSLICIMPQQLFLDIIFNHPEINRSLLRLLAARCRFLNMRLAEHCFLQTRHRLYIELLRLSRPRPGHDDQRSISPPPTQKDLAARIGTRREVVSREIASLKRDNVVDKTRGALVLINPARLQTLVSAGWAEAH